MNAKMYKKLDNIKMAAFLFMLIFIVAGMNTGFAQTNQQTAKDQKQSQQVQPTYKWHTTTRVTTPNNQSTKPVKLNSPNKQSTPKGTKTNANESIKKR